jgi:hypothetical protein
MFFLYGKQLAYAAALVAPSFALSWTWFSVTTHKDNQLFIDVISNHARSPMLASGRLCFQRPVRSGLGSTESGLFASGSRSCADGQSAQARTNRHARPPSSDGDRLRTWNHVINLFVWPSGDRKLDMNLQSRRGFCHSYFWNIAGFSLFCVSDRTGPDLKSFEDF